MLWDDQLFQTHTIFSPSLCPPTTPHVPQQAYIFYKRFLRLALDCIPEHIAYKEATFGREKNWLVGERRQALKALEEVNGAITAEIAERCCRGVASPSCPPVASAAPPSSPGQAMEDDLERRLCHLRGWDALSSKRLLSPLGRGKEGEVGHLLEDELHSPLSVASISGSMMLEPSAPPLFLDDGPPLPPVDADNSVKSGLSATELETAFNSLRLEEADDPASPRVRHYYPCLSSPVGGKKKEKEEEEEGEGKKGELMVSPFAVPGQEVWFRKRGMLRRMVLPSGLVGKFLEIADANSRKVRASVLVG